MPNKRRRFRKRGKRHALKISKGTFLLPVKPNKPIKKTKGEIVTHDYYLNPSKLDRMHYSYETDKDGVVQTVLNVSYEVFIGNEWIPLVRFDSVHGYLHRHMRVSKDDPAEILSVAGVRKKGTPQKWLSWAIKELDKTYLNYRAGFFKRSKIKDLY